MKRHLLTFIAIAMIMQVPAQEVFLDLQYSNSSLSMFQKSIGFDLGYSKITKSGNKIGMRLGFGFNPFDYDVITTTTSDPTSYWIAEVQPNSLWLSIQGLYYFRLYERENINMYLGPLISLNYFFIDESGHRLPNGSYTELDYVAVGNTLNRTGLGFIFESQVKDILFKNLDLIYSISPTIGSYEKFAAMGSNDPWFYLSVDFKVGVNYNFKVKKE